MSESKTERPSDEDILRFEKQIREEADGNMPLVGEKTPIMSLILQYEDSDEVFKTKVNTISFNHSHFRTIKKDGNCFYRATAFRLIELLYEYYNTDWATLMIDRLDKTKILMESQGYDMELLGDFYEPLSVFLRDIESYKISGKSNKKDTLTSDYNIEHISDTIVCYLRLVTGAELKKADFIFSSFLPDTYDSIASFVSNEVEPMSLEADQLQVSALANALGIEIKIANLDHSGKDLNYHSIEPGLSSEVILADGPTVGLLFKPGHYEILY